MAVHEGHGRMSLGAMIRWLVVLLLGSIAGLVIAARAESRLGIVLAVAAFAAAAVLVSARTNRYFWAAEPGAMPETAVVAAARRNARLLALTYAWGALAMQALYTPPLTGLLWWPGWPIAMILATLGVLTSAIGHFQMRIGAAPMSARFRRLIRAWFTGQAWSAAVLLVGLASAAPRNVARPEWGAVQLLTFCCLAVMMQSMFALRSHSRC